MPGVLDRVRRRVWGLSGRLTASCILITLAVVVLVEGVVLGFQVPRLVNGAWLREEVTAAATKDYATQLAQRYPGGVPAGVLLGARGRSAQPGQVPKGPYGTLVIPAISGPVHSRQPVTAVVVIGAKGTIIASSVPSRYPPGRAAASELPATAASVITVSQPTDTFSWRNGTGSTPYGDVFWVIAPEIPSSLPGGASGAAAYIYVQAPLSAAVPAMREVL